MMTDAMIPARQSPLGIPGAALQLRGPGYAGSPEKAATLGGTAFKMAASESQNPAAQFKKPLALIGELRRWSKIRLRRRILIADYYLNNLRNRFKTSAFLYTIRPLTKPRATEEFNV